MKREAADPAPLTPHYKNNKINSYGESTQRECDINGLH